MCTRFVFFVMAVLVGVSSLNAQGPGGQVPCVVTDYDVLYHASCSENYAIPNLPQNEASVCVVELANRCINNNQCRAAGRKYRTYNQTTQNDWDSQHANYAFEGNGAKIVSLKDPRKMFPCYTENYCGRCEFNSDDGLWYCTGVFESPFGIPNDELCPSNS
jgi:hypothetical protein